MIMNDELGRYYPVTCLEGLRKTTEDVSEDSESLGQD
jgi:hypothetical protein